MARRAVRGGSRAMGMWLDDLTKVTHGLGIVWNQRHGDECKRADAPEPHATSASNLSGSRTEPPEARKIKVTRSAKEAGALYDAYVQKRSEQFTPTECKVPATPLERVVGFSGVAAKLAFGTLGDYTRNALSSDPSAGGTVLSASNAERLASGLCRMRGAALKIGQMLSIQDNALVSPELTAMLQTVRQGADIMPSWQLEKMLITEWGDDWRAKFSDFDMKPVAAASLGQVHHAVLLDGTEVAVKVQYPGVADSIDSDIANLALMIKVLGLAPKGLYIERVMEEGRLELKRECDYIQEAAFQERFRELIGDDPVLSVPKIIHSLTTGRILTSEYVRGIPIDQLVEFGVDQETRNHVATSMLELCLREVFEFRFMQTDPNWSNFLFDPKTGKVQLLDFGASREFDQAFVQSYLQMVAACASRDKEAVIQKSIELGFITSEDSSSMLSAQAEAGFLVGEPFASEVPYDFAEGNISGRIAGFARTMVKERSRPPPKEIYTLHRKLSGAFLTCTKLNAVVSCRPYFLNMYDQFEFKQPNIDDE